MAAPYILARSLREAHTFARETLGLAHGHYRILNSAGTLKSVRNVDLYLVPGWRKRYDRFAMQSTLRWTRMNVIDVEKTPVEAPAPEPDGLAPAGVQLSFDELFGHIGQATSDMVSEGGPAAPEPEATPAEPEAKEPEVKRRRRRCKECGVLVEPDEVDSHAKDHESDLVAEVS